MPVADVKMTGAVECGTQGKLALFGASIAGQAAIVVRHEFLPRREAQGNAHLSVGRRKGLAG